MLMGTQWYLLFNVIAGAMAIPQDLKYTSVLLHLGHGPAGARSYCPPSFHMSQRRYGSNGWRLERKHSGGVRVFGGQAKHTVGIGPSLPEPPRPG